jgi:hypothetical protein
MYFSGIYLQELKNVQRNLISMNNSQDRDLSPRPSEYEARVIVNLSVLLPAHLQRRFSVLNSGNFNTGKNIYQTGRSSLSIYLIYFVYIRLCITMRLDQKLSIFGVANIAHVGIIYTRKQNYNTFRNIKFVVVLSYFMAFYTY